MKARDIMTANPRTLAPTETIRHAAAVMRELNVGAVPIVDGASSPKLRGIITDRDIATRCAAEGHAPHCLIRDHMTAAPLQTAFLDDDVEDVIETMERAQVRRIPVVTKEGELLGIIAQADVASRYGQQHPREVEELLVRMSAPSVVTHT
jgi:CBS domain-containing protein